MTFSHNHAHSVTKTFGHNHPNFGPFLKVIMTLASLTFGQGHRQKYFWKNLITYYHHTNFGSCRSNSVWENVRVWLFWWKNQYFWPFWRSLWTWPLVKPTVGSICESPFSLSTIMPNLVPVGQIVSEKMSNVWRFGWKMPVFGLSQGHCDLDLRSRPQSVTIFQSP